MKKIIYFVATIVMLMNTTACTEILDTMPHNKVPGEGMWSSESIADQGVVGVYSSLQQPVQGKTLVGEDVSIGYYGFDVFGMSAQGSYAIDNLFSASVEAGNRRFEFTWKWCYDGVHRANDAITNLPKVPMAANKKARLIAECKVLRAFFYSRLNELFGSGGLGVPLYLEPIAASECTRPQTPEPEIWAQIIKDLTDAINEPNLPNNKIQGDGRVSKGAAYALRGRAYLITKDYAKAVADFAEVGKCGYKLFPDYKNLFKITQERCEEMILSVQYIEDPSGYGSRLQKFCAPYQGGSKDGRGCWTDLQISPAVVDLYEVIVDNNTVKPFNWTEFIPEWNTLPVNDRKVFFIRDQKLNGSDVHSTITAAINEQVSKLSSPNIKSLYIPEGNEARLSKAYEKRDPRLDYNVILPYSQFKGVNHNSTDEANYISRWPVTGKYFPNNASAENNLRPGMLPSLAANASGKFYYMFRKFVGEGLEYARRQDNPVDEPIIRYADVVLMWAEALVEMNDLPGAMAKVKEIRDRAGVPTMSSSFSDQVKARNYVRDERRREFVGEGVNFFDEMRWRTLKQSKFDTKYPQMVWGEVSSGGTTYQWVGDYWYTWPVPKAEIELNPNLKRTPRWNY